MQKSIFLLAICIIVFSLAACSSGVLTDSEVTEDNTLDGRDTEITTSDAIGTNAFPSHSYLIEDKKLVEPDFTGKCDPDLNPGLLHPGVMVDISRLDFIKEKVKNKEEPWYASYVAMANHYKFKDLNFPSQKRSIVDCGANNGNPNDGCDDLVDSSSYAYAHALQYYVENDLTKKEQHAAAAIRVLNEWSSTMRDFGDGVNNMLVAGTAAGNFAAAAEILRYTYSGDLSLNISSLRAMFCALAEELYKPTFAPGTQVNFRTIRNNGLIALGVFLDNRDIFETGVRLAKRDFLGHVYLYKDGPHPLGFTHKSVEKHYEGAALQDVLEGMWRTSVFHEGQSQEFCRDSGHMAMGFAGAGHATVTAAIQGVDLLV